MTDREFNDPFNLLSNDAVSKLLSDVQQFGLNAATDVVARFSALAADEAERYGRTTARGADLGGWLQETQQTWTNFVEVMTETLGGTSTGHDSAHDRATDGEHARSRSTPPAASTSDADQALRPRSVSPGESAAVDLWLHNVGSLPLQVTSVTVGELRSPAGVRLDDVVCEAHRTFPVDVEPGGSLAIEISIRVPQTAAPGEYHGLVFAASADAGPLPIVLSIAGETS